MPSDYTPQQPKLLDQVRTAIRLRRMSYRTEQTYTDWIKRFIIFHHKRHPREMGAPEIQEFRAYLVNERNVAASTQNQALHSGLFLFVTASPRTCWNRAMRFVPYRNCSVTRMSKRR